MKIGHESEGNFRFHKNEFFMKFSFSLFSNMMKIAFCAKLFQRAFVHVKAQVFLLEMFRALNLC
jgi:hypothetical protein